MSPRRGWSYGHSIDFSSAVVSICLPASSRSTSRPCEVRTWAAMPPAAPDPTIDRVVGALQVDGLGQRRRHAEERHRSGARVYHSLTGVEIRCYGPACSPLLSSRFWSWAPPPPRPRRRSFRIRPPPSPGDGDEGLPPRLDRGPGAAADRHRRGEGRLHAGPRAHRRRARRRRRRRKRWPATPASCSRARPETCPSADRDALLRWIEAGHAVIGIHAAADTFHGYPAFLDMLGGEFAASRPAGEGAGAGEGQGPSGDARASSPPSTCSTRSTSTSATIPRACTCSSGSTPIRRRARRARTRWPGRARRGRAVSSTPRSGTARTSSPRPGTAITCGAGSPGRSAAP